MSRRLRKFSFTPCTSRLATDRYKRGWARLTRAATKTPENVRSSKMVFRRYNTRMNSTGLLHSLSAVSAVPQSGGNTGESWRLAEGNLALGARWVLDTVISLLRLKAAGHAR